MYILKIQDGLKYSESSDEELKKKKILRIVSGIMLLHVLHYPISTSEVV